MTAVYLPVQERIGLTSKQRAAGISQELYNLQTPKALQSNGNQTSMLLDFIEHPTTGQWACVGDTEMVLMVHPQRDVTALVALFPQLSTEERAAMTYYISTNEYVHFAYLMPSDSEQLTHDEAQDAGWFQLEFE